MTTSTQVHYHAVLECGHDLGFDTDDLEDRFLDEVAQRGLLGVAGRWSVALACSKCGGVERGSVTVVRIGPAEQYCECKRGADK